MRDLSVRTFVSVVIALALTPYFAVLLNGHLELHAAINRITTPALDPWFKYGTHLADGLVPTAFGLAFLFVRWRWFLMVAVSVLGSSIIAQSLKHTLFADVDRPSTFIGGMPDLRLVPGVEMLHHNSFPSGHSTCAFSMCFVAAVLIGRPVPAALLALLSGLLAFSRVYLSQHFTEDVLCGAMIGTGTAWAAYWWLYKSPFAKRPWLEGSLLKRQNQ
ncbi:MAG: phosphatase PAP2 family protein [Flavobacteriales bacterium]|nr:phosphatase PAP2 family protein [Flavobacteriales bacterium]